MWSEEETFFLIPRAIGNNGHRTIGSYLRYLE